MYRGILAFLAKNTFLEIDYAPWCIPTEQSNPENLLFLILCCEFSIGFSAVFYFFTYVVLDILSIDENMVTMLHTKYCLFIKIRVYCSCNSKIDHTNT